MRYPSGLAQCCGEFRPAFQCIGALTGLDLDILADNFATLSHRKAGDGIALGFDPQTALALLASPKLLPVGDAEP
jgi:hypothetical protein